MSTNGAQQGLSPQQAQYNNPYLNVNGAAQLQQMQQLQQLQQLQQQPPMQVQQPLSLNTNASAGGMLGNNPFTRSPTRIQSPNALGQIPEQSQASYFTNLPQSHTYPLPNGNPYGTSLQSAQSPGLQPPQQQINNPFMTQPPPPPQPPRLHNTASIMALYNMQQLAPSAAQSTVPPSGATSVQHLVQSPTQQPPQQLPAGSDFFNLGGQSQMPVASPSVNNPFFNMSSNTSGSSAQLLHNPQYPAAQPSLPLGQRQPPPPPPAPLSGTAKMANTSDLFVGGRSRDSMMALGMEWSNGRHSPDAFASLSAHH